MERYPKELSGTRDILHPPSLLPPQYIAILKWVNHSIANGDIREDSYSKYESVFSIEDMAKTINDKIRHAKVEVLNKNEYDKLLNNGKVSLGYLADIDDFVPAPRVLICGRCNQPGHNEKTYRSSSYDICRRGGGDGTILEQDKVCQIKCHHCGGEQVPPDYKCNLIDTYRRQLIEELRQPSERLTPLPPIFNYLYLQTRSQNDRSKIIYNHQAVEYRQQFVHPHLPSGTNHNTWPELRPANININNGKHLSKYERKGQKSIRRISTSTAMP